MNSSKTYETNWHGNDHPYRNKDMKDIGGARKAEEQVHLFRLVTILVFFVMAASIAWMFDKPSHPFKDVVQVVRK